MHTIAVTGVTGRVGSLVARSLSAAGIATRMVGRKPVRFPNLPGAVAAPPASYRDTQAMTVALRGADTMFMVSGTESDDRLVDHRSAIDAAVAAGVTRIIYTSFLSAAADCTFTFARDTSTPSSCWPVRDCGGWRCAMPSTRTSCRSSPTARGSSAGLQATVSSRR